MNKAKTSMEIENADTILHFIYYSLLNEKDRAQAVISKTSKTMTDKLRRASAKFMAALEKVYGSRFITRLRNLYKTGKKDIDKQILKSSGDKYEIYSLAGGDARLMTEDTLLCLACVPDYALDFLFAFNAEHDIIHELLPHLPEAEEASATAADIVGRTETPSRCILLAASTDMKSLAAGYVLKDFEFQGYTFSIYKQDNNSYSFEFISLHESLKNKIIHVSLVSPHNPPVIIEEKCLIDTRQYTLFYQGKLAHDADIKPGVITKE
jgi:hypothetical protein